MGLSLTPALHSAHGKQWRLNSPANSLGLGFLASPKRSSPQGLIASRLIRGNFQVAFKCAQLALDSDEDQEIIGRGILERPQPCLFGVEHLLEGLEPGTRLSNESILGRLLGIAAPTASSKVIVEREITEHVTWHILKALERRHGTWY
jgi:hypothetical protein